MRRYSDEVVVITANVDTKSCVLHVLASHGTSVHALQHESPQCVLQNNIANNIAASRKHKAQTNMRDAVHTTARTRWRNHAQQDTHHMTGGVL
jgi:hypothetical protein